MPPKEARSKREVDARKARSKGDEGVSTQGYCDVLKGVPTTVGARAAVGSGREDPGPRNAVWTLWTACKWCP